MGNDEDRGVIKQWSSIMSALFNLIYREYCKARLAEMQKQRVEPITLGKDGHEEGETGAVPSSRHPDCSWDMGDDRRAADTLQIGGQAAARRAAA
jgi:hypothetical protein